MILKVLVRKVIGRGIFYIGGSDVLPAPLKAEEEQQCIAALDSGDELAKQQKKAEEQKKAHGYQPESGRQLHHFFCLLYTQILTLRYHRKTFKFQSQQTENQKKHKYPLYFFHL
mgnify:CR=1 FL=1